MAEVPISGPSGVRAGQSGASRDTEGAIHLCESLTPPRITYKVPSSAPIDSPALDGSVVSFFCVYVCLVSIIGKFSKEGCSLGDHWPSWGRNRILFTVSGAGSRLCESQALKGWELSS